MRVGGHFGDLALQLDATGFVAFEFKLFSDHRHDFTGMETGGLRGHGLGKRVGRELVHLFAGDVVLFGQVFGRLDHVDACGRVFQRFPHVVFEAHRRAQLEAGAVVKGGNRVARHALCADHQRSVAHARFDLLARLAEQFKAGAANALGHDGGHFLRHTGIQTNVAGQEELVKVARGHVAGDDRADLGGGDACALQSFAGGFDAEVCGRDVTQCAAIVHHGRAHAFVHPHIGKRVEKSFGSHVFSL